MSEAELIPIWSRRINSLAVKHLDSKSSHNELMDFVESIIHEAEAPVGVRGLNEHRRMILAMIDEKVEPHAIVRVYGGIDHKSAKDLWLASFKMLNLKPPTDQYM